MGIVLYVAKWILAVYVAIYLVGAVWFFLSAFQGPRRGQGWWTYIKSTFRLVSDSFAWPAIFIGNYKID